MSLACIGPFAGLPAIILGATARKEIDGSGRTLEGRGLAAAGIVTGLFGTGFGVIALLYVASAVFAPNLEPADQTAAIQSPPPPSFVSPTPPPGFQTAGSTQPAAMTTRSFGSLEVVDLDTTRALRAQLTEVMKRSQGRTVLLQTCASTSAACAAIDRAFPDTRMQRALSNVTIIRVDVEEYRGELGLMKVETKSAPFFYKLDQKGEITESLSAESWDAKIPENMAPLLGKFVKRAASTTAPRHKK